MRIIIALISPCILAKQTTQLQNQKGDVEIFEKEDIEERNIKKEVKVTKTEEKTPSSWNLNKEGYHEFLDEINQTKLELNGTISTGLIKVQNSNFGAGSVDAKNAHIVNQNPLWSEYVFTPRIRFAVGLDNKSIAYGRLSSVGATTRGQGDASAISTTVRRPTLVAYEEVVAGWKSGELTSTPDLVDISFGQQCFTAGDGFVLGLGTVNAYKRAAFFLGPRSAFKDTAVLAINPLPAKAQIFHLRTNTNQQLLFNTDQPKTSIYGAYIEYASMDPKKKESKYWNAGLILMKFYKADKEASDPSQKNRDGLLVINPMIGGDFFPNNRDIRFHAGCVYQKNNKIGQKTKAYAYYLEPGYTFSNLWGSPLLFYRYSHFSGDSAGSVKKSYDPLMFACGTRDGYGTWETGQIQSSFYFSNTNQNVHNVQLKLTPSDKYVFGVQYFHINFDKLYQYNIKSKAGSRELDAYFTWTPNDYVSLTAIGGILKPKSGIKQYTIANSNSVSPSKIGKTVYMLGLMLTYTL